MRDLCFLLRVFVFALSWGLNNLYDKGGFEHSNTNILQQSNVESLKYIFMEYMNMLKSNKRCGHAK
jgi:hypothetical protein